MLFCILFALVALLALAAFFSPHPIEFGEFERVQRNLLLGGIVVVGVGMAVPSGGPRADGERARWTRGSSPGRSLGFLAKLLGWCGAAFVPLALASRQWLAAAACGLVLVSAVALWRRRAWAAWAWYAIALGAFVLAGRGLVEVPSKGLAAGGSAVLWSAVDVVLLREVTAWRRALAAPVRADDDGRDG